MKSILYISLLLDSIRVIKAIMTRKRLKKSINFPFVANKRYFDVKNIKNSSKYNEFWEFLAVQWLALGTFIAVVQVQSLVGERKSH